MKKLFKLSFDFIVIFVAAKPSYVQGQIHTASSKMFDQKYNNATQFLLPGNSSNRKMFFLKQCTTPDFLAYNVSTMCQERPKFSLHRHGFLLTFLLRLKVCQLVTGQPWLDEECAERFYNLTDYHKASYDKMCNPVKYASFCHLTKFKQNIQPSTIIRRWLNQRNIAIQDSYNKKQNESFNIDNFQHNKTFDIVKAASNLTRLEKITCQSIETFFEVLFEQILQEMFENVSPNSWNAFFYDQYTEWYLENNAFCEDVGCGISRKNYKNFSITFLDCVSDSCQIASIVKMAIDGVITFLIVVGNILVLIVFYRTTITKSIPGYFKLNLALADLGVGLIITPSAIYIRYNQIYSPLPYRCDGKPLDWTFIFGQSYLTVTSFFRILLLFASIFTLSAASLDRYLAITRPFKYKEGKYLTKKKTIVSLILVWLLSATLAVILIYLCPLNSDGNDLILAWNTVFVTLYLLFFGIPLISCWILNFAVFLKVRTDYRERANNQRRLSENLHSVQDQKNEDFNIAMNSNCTKIVAEIKNGGVDRLRKQKVTEITLNK